MILVAEDESVTQLILLKFLEKLGYAAQVVDDGRKCLEVMKSWLPDLVILDIMMPEMNGLEVLRAIRSSETQRNVRVLMLTSRGEKEIVREALRLDVDDFILKPLNLELVGPRVHLHMYQPDVSSVRDLLKTARLRDDSLFSQVGLKDIPRDTFEFYPVRTPDNLQISLRLPRFSLPDEMAKTDDFEIIRNVVLYAKGVKWKRIWPTSKDSTISILGGDQGSDEDFSMIIEAYS